MAKRKGKYDNNNRFFKAAKAKEIEYPTSNLL